MNKVSLSAQEKYNSLTKDPDLANYFALSTPVEQLADLHLGSRPAKRQTNAGLESLRAIPWVLVGLNQDKLFLVGLELDLELKQLELQDMKILSNEWRKIGPSLKTSSVTLK